MAIGDKSNQTSKMIIKHQVSNTEVYKNQTLQYINPSMTDAKFAYYANKIGTQLIDNTNYAPDSYYRQNQYDIALS
jgi:hypothetical protein